MHGLTNLPAMHKTFLFLPLSVLGAFVWPRLGAGICHRMGRMIARVSNRLGRAMAVTGLVSLTISVAVGYFDGIPAPQVNDEFGYLLTADTFLHGRLTNPTHPLWQHFESIHIIHQPTYAAKYPPGQAVALAVGKLLRYPIIGVWLSTALACALLCWMLAGWLPNRWAFAGGLLAAMHPQVIAWSHNYWGGSMAMGGGALLLGALRRILRAPRPRDALLMGVGMFVLANSRPYEGFTISLLGMVTLAFCLWPANRAAWGIIGRRVVLPLGLMLAVTAVQIGYYNWRVTGDMLRMPYMVHEDTYGVAPLFIFQKPKPVPEFRHKEIRDLQEGWYGNYHRRQTASLAALARSTWGKLYVLAQGFLWMKLLIIPLIALPWALRYDRWSRFALYVGGGFTATMMLGTWVFPHYAAPAMGLFFVLVLQSLRQLRVWKWRQRPVGRAVARGVLVLCVLSVPLVIARLATSHERWDFQRERMIASLEQTPGNHLVIVRYYPQHNANREWVYNSADIDNAKVVLARDMGLEKNSELFDYFPDRHVWLIEADEIPPKLIPYRLP